MGLLCSKETLVTHTNIEESEKNAEINRRITREHKEEQKVEKILLLGTGESGKSTIFKQIKVLFHAGFNNVELKRYIQVIHANVFQSIKILYDGSKEFAEAAGERSSYYILQPENQVLGEKFCDIGNQFNMPILTEELALQIEAVWKDPAIQATFQRSNELQIPDCTQFFLGNVIRLALPDYIPTQEDVLYARVRTTAIVEMEFSSPDSNRKDQIYRLCDVGGQRNERRKWIHLFDNVRAIIFCASLSEYDQTLYEDETKNRMMETKELFDKLLKESCFENTSFLVFLNKFDIFEKKVEQVPLNVCEWFNDYKYSNSGINEVDFAYEYVKGKFKEVYRQNTPPDRVCRVLRIYKTTALNRNIVKQTFDLVDETLTRWRLDQHELL